MDLDAQGVFEKHRRRDDRCQRRCDRQGRRAASSSKWPWRRLAWMSVAAKRSQTSMRPATGLEEVGLAAVVRPSFTMGGSGSAIAYNRAEYDSIWSAAGWTSSPDYRSADRRVDHRLERIRDGGDARRGRQRRDHLLDRKLRCDGRPHGRFDHGRTLRKRSLTKSTSECATRRLAVIREIGVETGGSNIQFAIHPENRADDRDRDEPARKPLQCSG